MVDVELKLPPIASAIQAEQQAPASGHMERIESHTSVGYQGTRELGRSRGSVAGSSKTGDALEEGRENEEEDEEGGYETAVCAEEYLFLGFPPPLDIHPDELLLHTAQIIVVPRKSGYSAFRRFLVEGNPTALDVVEHVFWYIHCKFFHCNSSRPQQQALLANLADLHLTMFIMLPPGSRDFFTDYFPFAVTNAACAAFEPLFPGSRDYVRSEQFQNEVYTEIRRVFTGVISSPGVVRKLRQKLHLVEKDPEVEEQRKKAMEPTFKEKTEAMISRLDKIFDLKTFAPSGVKRPPRQHRLPRRSEDSDYTLSIPSDDDEDHGLVPLKLKTHPPPRAYHLKFESTGVTPLLARLGYGQSGTRHIFMKQTQPPLGKPEGRHKYRTSAIKAKAEVAHQS